jgi:pimeloyl-ACP methyl ester carboxylesterase
MLSETSIEQDINPYIVNIPDESLRDLRDRLRNSRLPLDFANDQWAYGTNSAYLRELITYYLEEYDWRSVERRINSYPHFKTVIDGIPIHFMKIEGKGRNPAPLIMSHGFPWTFWDFEKIIKLLTDPAAVGGDEADSFTLVIPSLPGHVFSTPVAVPGVNFWRTADLWNTLMTQRLGYARYFASGGDWGSQIAAQAGHKYPGQAVAVHVHLQIPLSAYQATHPDVPPGVACVDAVSGLTAPSEYGPDEQGWFERNVDFLSNESGYAVLQSTKPQTVSFALDDSAAGLWAWLLDKRRRWADTLQPDGTRDIESRFSKEDLATLLTLYWASGSFSTAARYYYETLHNPWRPSHGRFPVVEAATGVAVFTKDVFLMPRKWTEGYYNLKRYNVFSQGGHWAPAEEPETLATDLTEFFRDYRQLLKPGSGI